MMGIAIWFILGAIVSAIFLVKESEYRIGGMEIIAAFMIMCGWPIYVLCKFIMRLFNGDWK